MPLTDLDLANAALSLLGEPPLASFTDDRKAARVLEARIPSVRDALMRSHPWNWAVSRATLAELVAEPPFGFARGFALPIDYLRLLAFNDHCDTFAIERLDGKRALLTDASAAELLYIARVENPALWDPLFFEALAAALAYDIFPSILGTDAETFERTRLLFIERVRLARSVDAQENPPGELFADDFLAARFGSSRFRRLADPS